MNSRIRNRSLLLYPSFLVITLCVPARGAVQSLDGDLPGANSSTLSSPGYVVAKSGNGQTWESVAAVTNSDGAITLKTNRVQELATGMHYFDSSSGQWKQSEPAFTEALDSFVAEKVQAKVTLQRDLNVGGAVFITTPDQKQVYATPVAVGLFAPETGAFAVIGEITNCAGNQVSSNMVVYENPFSDGNGGRLCGSLVFTIGQATFEQDYIWTANIDPQAYGFNTNCWLQVISEIQSAPDADIIERPIYVEQDEAKRAQYQNPDIFDQVVGWGEFVLGTGRAYTIGEDGSTLAPAGIVSKELRREPTRSLLIESAPFAALASSLAELPPCQPQGPGHAQAQPKKALKTSYASIVSPQKSSKGAVAERKPPQTAKIMRKPAGVAIDYIGTIGGTLSSATVFSSSTNWYVSSVVNCNGAVTIEGGTIFKYKASTSLNLNSTLTLKSSTYRPAIFTALDDDTIGDTMSTNVAPSYTGVISTNGYANPALYLNSAATLSNCRFLYAKAGVVNETASGITITVNHSQFIKCIKGVALSYSGSGCAAAVTLNLNNVLMTGVGSPVSLPTSPGHFCTMINCTVDNGTNLFSGNASVTLRATNSVFANLSGIGATAAGDHNGFYKCPNFGVSTFTNTTVPFQTVGCASYYLADVFRDSGTTTGVSASLQTDLKLRTTYPPTVVTQVVIAVDTTLWPEVPRDVDTIDLGYHMDPLDFAFSGVSVTGAVLTVNAGTAIATFGGGGATNGLVIGQNGQFISTGSPKQPVWIVQFNTVQEGSATNWQRTTYSSVASELQGLSGAPTINCRFTDWSMLSLDGYQFRAPTNTGPLNFRDCEFHGGKILSTWPTLNFTNCLLERIETDIEPGDNLTSNFRNNLAFGGKFGYGPTNSLISDNYFDQVSIPNWIGARLNSYSGGYNAYVTNCDRLQATQISDLVLATNAVAYKIGTFGNYYQATNSPLVNAGSTTADLVSLFQSTVTTNLVSGLQIKETNSVVDIGVHYVAADSGGNLIDTDGDGIADIFEDINNNGRHDSGESDWQSSENGTTLSAGLVVFTFLE